MNKDIQTIRDNLVSLERIFNTTPEKVDEFVEVFTSMISHIITLESFLDKPFVDDQFEIKISNTMEQLNKVNNNFGFLFTKNDFDIDVYAVGSVLYVFSKMMEDSMMVRVHFTMEWKAYAKKYGRLLVECMFMGVKRDR